LVKTLTVHSYKGGTGKTAFSINIAHILCKRKRNVCLLDFDFRAPSQHVWFKTANVKLWLNDFLNGRHDFRSTLISAPKEFINFSGNLFVGLANPATEAIRDMSAKSRRWEMKALGKLLSTKKILDDMEIDYLIIDTSPGLAYSSINAIVASDLALILGTIEASDLEGIQSMTHDLYDLFDTKSAIVLNRLMSIDSLPRMRGIKRDKSQGFFYDNIPILGIIPCFCDVQKSSRGYSFAKEKPDHPFTKILEEIAAKIDSKFLPPVEKLQDVDLLQRYRDIFLKKATGIYMSNHERS
jgi:septum site-determining protein MinD